MITTEPSPHSYVLNHSEPELRRLEAQGAFLKRPTLDMLTAAGLEPRMRVLDIGCGAGDVSFLAAELVGPEGEVIGLDRSEDAVAVARSRAAAKGLHQVQFLTGDFASAEQLAGERPFDAVVGRLVLIHHPQPVAGLSQLVRALRPGGILAFHEIDVEAGYWATRPIPALDQLWHWVVHIERAGRFTGGLGAAFLQAFEKHGMSHRRVLRTGALENHGESGVYQWLSGFVRTIVPIVHGLGGDTRHADVDTYEARLRAQVRESGATFVPAHMIWASARTPM